MSNLGELPLILERLGCDRDYWPIKGKRGYDICAIDTLRGKNE